MKKTLNQNENMKKTNRRNILNQKHNMKKANMRKIRNQKENMKIKTNMRKTLNKYIYVCIYVYEENAELKKTI